MGALVKAARSGMPLGPDPGESSRRLEVVAHDDRFEPSLIEATAGEELLVTLTNAGREKHSIAFYSEAGGVPLADSAIGPTVDPGNSAMIAVTAPDAGEYVFVDEADPAGPLGAFFVRDEARRR
jgi:plastocyanin